MKTQMSDKTLLFSLFFLALGLRMAGIMYGDVHPDENFNLSVRVLAGEIVPHSHFYPPLLNYLNAMAYVFLYGVGRVMGFWYHTEEFKMQWFQNPIPFYFVGRMVTVIFGALASPLAYFIAKKMKCRRSHCLLIGVLFAILPIHLLLSHISKSDVPLGTALLLIVWVYLCYERLPFNSLLLGVASAVALGFKHSVIFFIAPLIAILSFQIYLSKRSVLKFMVTYSIATIVTFSIVSIGVILDLENFIQFQKVQSLVAIREFSLTHLWERARPVIGSAQYGASLPLILLWFVIPLLDVERRMATLWMATSIGMGTLLVLSGDRIQANIFLPFTMVVVLLTAISLSRFLEKRERVRMGHLVMASILLIFLVPAVNVVVQSLRTPISYEVSSTIRRIAKPNQTKILTSDRGLMKLPTDPAALLDEKKRHRQLANKYQVTLPEASKEKLRILQQKLDPSYYVRQIPWALGGLEAYDESEVAVIVPFGWPIQKHEWELSYWTDQGYSLFVIKDEEFFLNSGIPDYRRLHREIHDQCKLVAEIPTQRPLHFESDVKIYQFFR